MAVSFTNCHFYIQKALAIIIITSKTAIKNSKSTVDKNIISIHTVIVLINRRNHNEI